MNHAEKAKNRVSLNVRSRNGRSELVFTTNYRTTKEVERVFGRMHFHERANYVYPFKTCILQFWKALDWKLSSGFEKEKVPTGKFKSYSVSDELVRKLKEETWNSPGIKRVITSIREYLEPKQTAGRLFSRNKNKKAIEIDSILYALEADLLEQVKKHTEGLRRRSDDEIIVDRTFIQKRLEIEFETFIIVVEDVKFAQLLHALKPAVQKIAEKVKKLKAWRSHGIPDSERDYKFYWERENKPELKPDDFDKPFDHQWVMYKIHTLLDTSADLSQMGTGKTLSCLMTIDKRIQEGKVRKGHIIIVAPTTTLELAWQKQIKKFTPHLTSSIVKGSYAARMNMFLSPAEQRGDILLMNYESFAMETKVPKKDRTTAKVPLAKLCELVKWDMVVLDECHKIKNPEAKRTGHLVGAFKGTRHKMIMSGTINANKLFDIHVPFIFLNNALNFNSLHEQRNGEPLTMGELFGDFRDRYFDRDGWTFTPLLGTVTELREKLEEVSVRFEKSECLTLPEKMYMREELVMSEKQSQLYNALRDKMIADLTDINLSAGRVSVLNILAMMTKLAEAANGWIYNNAHQAIDLPWNPKLERVKEIVGDIDLDTQKIVIWSRFTHDLHLISETLREVYGEEAVVVVHGGSKCQCGSDSAKREEHVNAFLDMKEGNKVKIIVVNQAVGSHGIDLTSASYEIFYSNSFSKTDRIQSEDRCHRVGMRDSLTVIDLICKGTVDEQVMIALTTHKAMTVALLESLGIELDIDLGEKEEPPVIKIQQQGPRECLLASCAMIAGKTVDEARRVTQNELGIKPWVGTIANMLKLFEHWGVGVKQVWEMNDTQKGVAVVSWSVGGKHAIAFHGGQVYDPTLDKPRVVREWLANMMEKGGKMHQIWRVI